MRGEIGDLEQSTVRPGTREASLYQSFCYSVDAPCQRVHVFLLYINSILFDRLCSGNGMNHPKIMAMLLACTVHAGGPWYLPPILSLGG